LIAAPALVWTGVALGTQIVWGMWQYWIPAQVDQALAGGGRRGRTRRGPRWAGSVVVMTPSPLHEPDDVGAGEIPPLESHVIVLMGATGDLARRKLLPGLLPLLALRIGQIDCPSIAQILQVRAHCFRFSERQVTSLMVVQHQEKILQ